MASDNKFASTDIEIGSTGKAFFSSIASWLMNEAIDALQVEGTDSQIDAVKNAMLASRDFQSELHNPDATLKSITEKLEIKSKAANVFETEIGMPWLL